MEWTNLKEQISLAADIISIVGVTIASIVTGFYAIFKRNRDYMAMKVSLILAYLFKAIIIFFVMTTISLIGYGIIESSAFIDREPILLSISILLLVIVICLVAIWLLGSLIWMSSTRHIIGFVNALGFKLERVGPKLEILNAWYGSDSQNVDVTSLLIQLLKDNKLEVRASNELAGDPHNQVFKKMVVSYRYNSKLKSKTINEGEVLKLPIEEI